MLEKILPEKIFKIISEKVGFRSVNEIRLRAEKPIVLSCGGKSYFVCESGLCGDLKKAICSNKIMIEDVVFRASECSIYSVNEQIKKGFIVTDEAIRIGIGGNVIEENGHLKTMSNFSSCNIRIPHSISDCSLNAFNQIYHNNCIENTLIVSPPGCGKTTFLRDFVRQLSERNIPLNILLIDERGELDFGIKSNFTDRIAFSTKRAGFENGIRALSPDVIVTDELGGTNDIDAIKYATTCGVKLLCSVHSDDLDSLSKKEQFKELLQQKIFKRFVVLSKRNGPGTFEGVYDENFSRVYR